MPGTRHRILLKLLICTLIILAGAGVVVGFKFYLYAKPRWEKAQTFDLEEIHELEQASIIYDRNGEELGRIFVQNREPIPLDEVSENFINALVATEDSRFWVHDGVDYVGVIRAAIINFRAGTVTQGASTITQQLARNAFELRERSISRKAVEAFLAQRIEKQFTKREILELYSNRIYFGSGFYGISAAAQGYFGKPAAELTIAEAATLAALIKSPNRLSPFNNREESRKERNYVLKRMRAEGYIDRDEMDGLMASPVLTIKKGSVSRRSKYVYEQVRQRVIDLVGYERASEGGFRIFTTIDTEVQRVAEESLVKHLDRIERHPGYTHQTRDAYLELRDRFLANPPPPGIDGTVPQPPKPRYLQGAVLLTDNHTGAIRALVGGRNFLESMYDRAIQGRLRPGMSFTPLVYATAFENGAFPGTQVLDAPIDNRFVMIGGTEGILGEWGTESRLNVHEGRITARHALVLSKVAATVRLGTQAGLQNVVDLARRAGIRFVGETQNFNATLLGRSEAGMQEMCLAYSIFPNGGTRPRSTYIISSIRDSSDREIYTPHVAMVKQPVVDPYTAHQITSCLSEALEIGTGRKAREVYGLKDFPAAGKSGTEYGYTDNWFIGYTSEVTCAVWCGFDTSRTIYEGAFSSDTILPVWTDVMNAAADNYPPQAFESPRGSKAVEICRVSGQIATEDCHASGGTTDGESADREGAADQLTGNSDVTSPIVTEYLRPSMNLSELCEVHGVGGLRRRGGLTMSASSLKAQVAHARPIMPLGPTIIGADPYEAFQAPIRARVVAVSRDTPPEEKTEKDASSEPPSDEPSSPVPLADQPKRGDRPPREISPQPIAIPVPAAAGSPTSRFGFGGGAKLPPTPPPEADGSEMGRLAPTERRPSPEPVPVIDPATGEPLAPIFKRPPESSGQPPLRAMPVPVPVPVPVPTHPLPSEDAAEPAGEPEAVSRQPADRPAATTVPAPPTPGPAPAQPASEGDGPRPSPSPRFIETEEAGQPRPSPVPRAVPPSDE